MKKISLLNILSLASGITKGSMYMDTVDMYLDEWLFYIENGGSY